MPTTRLMKFSPTGVSEEVSADGVSRTSHGVRGVSSSHFLKLIEDRGQVGFWTSDVITSVCTISIGYYRLLGIDPSTPFGFHDLLAVMHPDDRPIHSDMCELLRSGHAIDRQFRIIRPDGTLRWVQNKAEVIVGVEGRPARAVGVIFDITEQSAARQSVEEGWFRYRTLIESIAVMEIHVTASGEFVNIEGWQTLTSQTEAQFSGSGWLEAIHPMNGLSSGRYSRPSTIRMIFRQSTAGSVARTVSIAHSFCLSHRFGTLMDRYASGLARFARGMGRDTPLLSEATTHRSSWTLAT